MYSMDSKTIPHINAKFWEIVSCMPGQVFVKFYYNQNFTTFCIIELNQIFLQSPLLLYAFPRSSLGVAKQRLQVKLVVYEIKGTFYD